MALKGQGVSNAYSQARVPIKGSIGKVISLPSVGGATIGVDLYLPDGSIPSLAQLKTLLGGTTTVNQSTTLVGGTPGGTTITTVAWTAVTLVPPNVSYPPRFVLDQDEGEDYGRMAIPGVAGAAGAPGAQGLPASVHLWPDEPEDVMPVPGASGNPGATGAVGPAGLPASVHLWPDEPEDVMPVPGAAGNPGATGAVGPAGLPASVHLWPDDAEDIQVVPGVPGTPGAPGGQGVPAIAHLWPDDAEDALVIPGATGLTGATGAPGGQGVPAIAHLWPDDAEDALVIPGAAGAAGATGATGAPGGQGVPAIAHLWPDDAEDALVIPGPIGLTGAQGTTGVTGAAGASCYLQTEDPDDVTYMGVGTGSGGPWAVMGGLAVSGGAVIAGNVNAAAHQVGGAPLILGAFWNPSDSDTSDDYTSGLGLPSDLAVNSIRASGAVTITNDAASTLALVGGPATGAPALQLSATRASANATLQLSAGTSSGSNIINTSAAPLLVQMNGTTALSVATTGAVTVTSTAATQLTVSSSTTSTGVAINSTFAGGNATLSMGANASGGANIINSTTGVNLNIQALGVTAIAVSPSAAVVIGQLQVPSTGAYVWGGYPVNVFALSNPAISAASANTSWFTTTAALTITIPANGSVAFPVGTELRFLNGSAGTLSIAITSDTMTLANSASTGTRTLASNGVATVMKVTATNWVISGYGLT